ncbi:MAG: hypothetical protein F7C34_01165 [Desulfurococcales archaeon]|nr:hypothetical protein [Desulfurococcales archaeon]
MARSISWYVKEALKGVLDAALLVILYLEIFPLLMERLYESMGYSAPNYVSSVYLTVLVGISILTISARLLRDTFLEPVLRASANLMGILYVLSYLGTDTLVEVNNIPAGDYMLDIKFDLGPLLLIFFGFFVAPGVIMPFISYYVRERD